MKRNYDQATSLDQNRSGIGQYLLQLFELLVDGNPERLKGPCGWVTPPALVSDDVRNQLGQLPGGMDWLGFAPGHDCPGNRSRWPFVRITSDHISKIR